MKPVFFINKFQTHECDQPETYYFHFLSESVYGNQIVITIKNINNYVIQKYIHTYDKNNFPEEITILLPYKKERFKYYYDVKNRDEKITYYEGTFLYIPNISFDGYISMGFVSGMESYIYEKVKYMKYDILIQNGFSMKKSYHSKYKKNSDISDILYNVRNVLKKKYADEFIGQSMRNSWNIQMYSQSDFSDSLESNSLVNEYLYYMKVGMSPYFISPVDFFVNGTNHYCYTIGEYNIIMFDNVMHNYYKKDCMYICEKITPLKKNIIVYGGKLKNESYVLSRLFDMVKGNNIFICNQNFENGKSYVIENKQDNKKIMKMHVSEFDQQDTTNVYVSVFINYFLKYLYVFLNLFKRIKQNVVNTKSFSYNKSHNYGEYMYDKYYIYSWK